MFALANLVSASPVARCHHKCAACDCIAAIGGESTLTALSADDAHQSSRSTEDDKLATVSGGARSRRSSSCAGTRLLLPI